MLVFTADGTGMVARDGTVDRLIERSAIEAGGRRDKSTWKCTNFKEREFFIEWPTTGEWARNRLSDDGQQLFGFIQGGARLIAKKVR